MDEDKCENCWWHWTVDSLGCHHMPKPIGYDSIKTENCGYFEPKDESVQPDEYRQYQEEWN